MNILDGKYCNGYLHETISEKEKKILVECNEPKKKELKKKRENKLENSRWNFLERSCQNI